MILSVASTHALQVHTPRKSLIDIVWLSVQLEPGVRTSKGLVLPHPSCALLSMAQSTTLRISAPCAFKHVQGQLVRIQVPGDRIQLELAWLPVYFPQECNQVSNGT